MPRGREGDGDGRGPSGRAGEGMQGGDSHPPRPCQVRQVTFPILSTEKTKLIFARMCAQGIHAGVFVRQSPRCLFFCCSRPAASLLVRWPFTASAAAAPGRATRPKREGTTCEAGIGGGEGGGDAAVGSGEPGGLACPPQRELSVAVRSWTAVGLRRQPAVGGRGQGARRGETWRRTAARRRLISWL